jgi:uncharacterized protein (TIGR03437 family)
VSPGEITVVYGSGLGPEQLVQGTFDTKLGGVQVLFNGIPAPIVYAWSKQIAAIAPYALTGSATARVQVLYQGQTVFDQTASVGASNPALFTVDGSGSGQAGAANQDGTPNSATNPAPMGSAVMLFATGEGQTSPAGQDGKLATTPLALPKQTVTATIAGQDATVEYAGSAPGEVAGVIQITVRIPFTVPRGLALPVVITIGGNASPAGVTIAVK